MTCFSAIIDDYFSLANYKTGPGGEGEIVSHFVEYSPSFQVLEWGWWTLDVVNTDRGLPVAYALNTSISTKAQYATLLKYVKQATFSYYLFFPTPPMKLKTATAST
jgi:hypothetical protein